MDLISLLGGTSDSVIRSDTALIRSSHATSQSQPSLHDTDHFKRLVEGFQFSRWFILTYQPVVLGVVVIVAWCRQYERWKRVKRWTEKTRRRDEDGRRAESSSSSSTGSGSATPSAKVEDEWTRLLPSSEETTTKPRPWTAPYRYLHSALLYQPPPLQPINKTLPPNTTSLWILSLFALNLFYALYNIGWHSATFDVLSDRSGLLFMANLPWLYLLAAKNQPLKYLTGDSYENLNMLHRRLGEWMCLLAVLHFGGMLVAWYESLRPLGFTLWRFLTIEYILFGCGAWVCYEVLYLMSLGSFREWWYEIFLGSHVLLQVAALVFFYLHHFRARPYVLLSLAVFVLDRFFWRVGLKNCVVEAELRVMEDGETVLVSADWEIIKQRSWLKRNMKNRWYPSEHVFISVPGMKRKHKWQFHPMTIASAAPREGQTHAWFNLIIRAKGGFSRDLLEHAKLNARARVRLDGPYGSLHALEMLRASDVAVVVAGGSGIAVAYPLLWDLLHAAEGKRQEIVLIWIIQDASHLSWIGNERLEELQQLGLHLVIPPPSRSKGRPDVKALLEQQVDEREGSVGVIVSGPDGLNRTVQNCCAEMVRRGREVDVAVEKFGW